ncbi:MAG: hypothetical protein ABIO79_17525 [Ferruginibacter sp.]
MGENNNKSDRTRRSFLSLFLNGNNDSSSTNNGKPEMVKMLTADGKLVEVDRTVLEAASNKQKSSNKEIYDWMENPSKENKS